jgi:TonB-dependent receptor
MAKKTVSVLLIFALSFANLYAQRIQNRSLDQAGVLTGTVADGNNNRKLSGATIVIQGTSKNTLSDNDGKFTFQVLKADTITITVSYVGYDTKQISGVIIKAGEVTNLSITLDLSKSNLKNVIVKTEARRENLAAVLNIRRNASVVSDVISADMIKRSPDKNTSDVLKRVSGTTIQDNKFVVVRGMNDRYNEAMLNGALMPSSEPDRKTFAFDIFPADLVDNITVIKSATPELPGSFSGGLIQINTKDVPDKKFWSAKAGVGMNSLTLGKDVYAYHGSGKDFIGVDNGTRALPHYFPGTEAYSNSTILNKAAYSRLFSNNWAYFKRSGPANFAMQTSGGFAVKLSKKKEYPVLAGVLGGTYNSSYKTSYYQRADYQNNNTTYDTNYLYSDTGTTRTVLASALTNVTLKINPSNKIYFNNIYSVNSSDQIVIRSGPQQAAGRVDTKQNSFFFSSNLLYNGQIGGDHSVKVNNTKLRIKWMAYLTTLNRKEPDYRRNLYIKNDETQPFTSPLTSVQSASTNSGVHYFGKLQDNSQGINVDMSFPFKWLSNTQTVKFGGSIYHNTRSRDARFLAPTIANTDYFNNSYLTYGQDSIFAKSHFNRKTGFVLYEDNRPLSYHYDGSINTTAFYAMMDNKFTRDFRAVWGLRFEKYHNIVNTGDENGNPLKRDTTYNDFLPSVNLIYTVLPKANLRFSYSKTVARAQYRELANVIFYDFLENVTYFGNPKLTETYINNLDLRWEHYFPQSQYYSASVFYKSFKNPIEPYIAIAGADSKTIGFENQPKAYVTGIELEGRKNLDFIDKKLENLVAYANVTFIKSSITTLNDTTPRPMQGQSPYVINASLQYNEPKTDLAISLLYNVVGPRIRFAGSQSQQSQVNTIWEKPHAMLDLKIQKTLLKQRGMIELTFSDILHGNDYQFWNLADSKVRNYKSAIDHLIVRQSFGFNVTIAASYKIF